MRSTKPWFTKVAADATDVGSVPDAEIDALSREARAELADIWQERGASELKVGGSFAAITAEVLVYGTPDTALKILARAVRDEVHHAEIAVDMAARYRGDNAVLWPPPATFPVPAFAPADPKLRATLLVIALCCINETLACGILEGQLSIAKSPLTRAALQTVLADEIDHARAGWAHIVSPFVTEEMKKEIGGGGWLPRLLHGRLKDLTDADSPFPGEQFPEHGILTRKARKEIVATALKDVVFPGFDRAGLDTASARDWAATAFG